MVNIVKLLWIKRIFFIKKTQIIFLFYVLHTHLILFPSECSKYVYIEKIPIPLLVTSHFFLSMWSRYFEMLMLNEAHIHPSIFILGSGCSYNLIYFLVHQQQRSVVRCIQFSGVGGATAKRRLDDKLELQKENKWAQKFGRFQKESEMKKVLLFVH